MRAEGAFLAIAALSLLTTVLLRLPGRAPAWQVELAFVVGAFVMLCAATPRRPR